MFHFISSLRAHSNLFSLGDLLARVQTSDPFAYITTAVGLLLVAFWFARLHTRLLAANRQLRLRLSEAEAKSQATQKATAATNDFLARITHEMRTPMNGIVSFAALALKTELTDVQREYLDRVLTSAEWLTHVVSDVLDFTRMESSQLLLDQKDFSLAGCIAFAAKMVEPAAQQKHLELTHRVDPRIPDLLNGDPNRFRQVVVNLLDNAVRYTTAGSIVVSAGIAAETPEALTVSVAVADTGIGIRQEDQARIFQPFQTASPAGTENFGGTGLGLSICKSLAEAMGGSIEVQSQIGAGSTFRFTAVLQRVRAKPAERDATALLAKLAVKRLAILLADENVVSRRLTTKLLESVGHQVSPAATAGETLTLFSTEIFDLVLVSSELTDMRGLTLAQALRKLDDRASHTQIYILRAQDDAVSPGTYLEAGLDGVVSRPTQVDQLLLVVQDVCVAKATLEHAL